MIDSCNKAAWGPKSPPASDYGIYLAGSIGGGNVLTGNTFEDNPNTAYSVDFYSGIYSQDFTNTVFCENNLRECAYPMYFQGTSMGTQYFANTHTGGSHSFRVENGFIGEQGIEGGEHHGNEMNGMISGLTLSRACTPIVGHQAKPPILEFLLIRHSHFVI